MAHQELDRCIDIIKKLRHPVSGCPWDLAQTHKSLAPYLLEESYEFIEAIENDDHEAMEEELGDVLFQVLLHSSMALEKNVFTLESSAKKLADKLVRRHPHVFNPQEEKLTAEEVAARWQKIKGSEKSKKEYFIHEKDLQAPALASAFKIGQKTSRVNFDWDNYQQVVMKVEEEWQEVKEELPPTGKFDLKRVREEIGDLLFSVAQLARHLEINPEECLRDANKKFIKRFKGVEDLASQKGKALKDTPQEILEKYWVEVKNR